MNQQQMLDVVAKIEQLAQDINEMAKGFGTNVPWKKWYAWYPVWTISNERIWLKSIYRRQQGKLFKRYEGYDYATDFDLLKDEQQ